MFGFQNIQISGGKLGGRKLHGGALNCEALCGNGLSGRGRVFALVCVLVLACVLAVALSIGGLAQYAFAASGYQTPVEVGIYVVDGSKPSSGSDTHRPVDDGSADDQNEKDKAVTSDTQVGIFITDSEAVAEGPASGASASSTLGIRLVNDSGTIEDGMAHVEWSLDGVDIAHGAKVLGARWNQSTDDEMDANVVASYVDAGTSPEPPYDAAVPTSDTHTFVGWILNGDSSKIYSADAVPADGLLSLSSITFDEYERYRFDVAWEGKWKKISLDAAGGSIDDMGEAVAGVYTDQIQYGATYTLPDAGAVHRDGATFLGWKAQGEDDYTTEVDWDGPSSFVAYWSAILSCKVPAGVQLDLEISGKEITVTHIKDATDTPVEYAFESNSIQTVYVTDIAEGTADVVRDPFDGETPGSDGKVHVSAAQRAANLEAIFRGSSLTDTCLTMGTNSGGSGGANAVSYKLNLYTGALETPTNYLAIGPIGTATSRVPVQFGLSDFKPHEVSHTNMQYLTVGNLVYTISFERP